MHGNRVVCCAATDRSSADLKVFSVNGAQAQCSHIIGSVLAPVALNGEFLAVRVCSPLRVGVEVFDLRAGSGESTANNAATPHQLTAGVSLNHEGGVRHFAWAGALLLTTGVPRDRPGACLHAWSVDRAGPSLSINRTASVELPSVRYAPILASERFALVQLKGTQGYSRIEVIGLPTLERLRSIKLGADRDRLVFSGTHLVERKESLGLVGVKLWALDDILASSSEAVPQPAADDSSEEEVVEAMHTLVPPKAGLVGPKCTAISSSVVAASFCQVNSVHCWEVYCWDVNTRELLRKISLPSRNHPHFHPNVVVPNALSKFGYSLDLDDYRIAVSAEMRHRGDWREEVYDLQCNAMDGPDTRNVINEGPGTGPARSLLVVQEFGPGWLRES